MRRVAYLIKEILKVLIDNLLVNSVKLMKSSMKIQLKNFKIEIINGEEFKFILIYKASENK
jgi:hypothetical protein